MALESRRLSRLEHLGFIRADGADAAGFLHGQLSRAIEGLPAGLAPLAAWHNAKGRVLAIVRVVAVADGWLLVTHADMMERLLSGLQRFVLRSKVTLADANAGWRGGAVLAPGARWLEQRVPGLGAGVPAAASAAGLEWIRVGPDLVHVFGPAERVEALAGELPPAAAAAATLAEIRLGLPEITPATAENYLPQMLNLDLLGGISFDKGCYPGQEVIARTQNRGTVKRRLQRFGAVGAGLPAPGAQICDERGEPAGEVIRAAPASAGIELLAVAALARNGALYLEPSSAERLEPLELPYRWPG